MKRSAYRGQNATVPRGAVTLGLIASGIAVPSTPARADSIWAGVYRHDITLAQIGYEHGADFKAGWIGEPIGGLEAIGSPAPYVLASKSLATATDYAAVGLNWTFGSTIYARPGLGLAVNDDRRAYRKGRRVDLGSPITFEPEIALGWRARPGLALEASWIHLSHATLFSRQNRGLDSWGVRAVVGLR